MSRHAWVYRAGLPADVSVCSLAGCAWRRHMDSGGRLTYHLQGAAQGQTTAPPCKGQRPAKPPRVRATVVTGRASRAVQP